MSSTSIDAIIDGDITTSNCLLSTDIIGSPADKSDHIGLLTNGTLDTEPQRIVANPYFPLGHGNYYVPTLAEYGFSYDQVRARVKREARIYRNSFPGRDSHAPNISINGRIFALLGRNEWMPIVALVDLYSQLNTGISQS